MKKHIHWVILGLICVAILVSPSVMRLIQDSQVGTSTQEPAITGAEWNALKANALKMAGRTIVVNDTAIDFSIETLQGGPFGISADGYYMSPDQPYVIAVVNQYTVTLSGFAGGTMLGDTNAVLDVVHQCIIYLHQGQYIALVIVVV